MGHGPGGRSVTRAGGAATVAPRAIGRLIPRCRPDSPPNRGPESVAGRAVDPGGRRAPVEPGASVADRRRPRGRRRGVPRGDCTRGRPGDDDDHARGGGPEHAGRGTGAGRRSPSRGRRRGPAPHRGDVALRDPRRRDRGAGSADRRGPRRGRAAPCSGRAARGGGVPAAEHRRLRRDRAAARGARLRREPAAHDADRGRQRPRRPDRSRTSGRSSRTSSTTGTRR